MKRELAMGATGRCFLALLLSAMLSPALAKADVSLLMMEAIGASGEATSAGHTSMYFSNICADGPVRVRPCQPGETGIVLAVYPNFGANQAYDWIAVPLLPHLYGVDQERNIPLYVNGEIRTLMRELYRRTHLRDIVPDSADGRSPEGQWREMIGNAYNRDIYGFTLKTTEAEDARIIEKLNGRPNISHFSTMDRNCADFAMEILNNYFPGATSRDFINDFTMTSPKAVAKSLARYASKRPERLFTVTKYSQLSGPIRRSLENRKYTEMAFMSKKYLVPLAIYQPEMLGVFVTSYFILGRFSSEEQYFKYATSEIARLNLEEQSLKSQSRTERENGMMVAFVDPDSTGTSGIGPRPTRSEIESAKTAERVRVFGTETTWKKYREEFAPLLQKAIADRLFLNEKEVKTFFKDLELQSEPALDENGALILRVSAYGKDEILGLTRENIMSRETNPHLAYKLLLAKVNATLNAKSKNRESLEVFEGNWDLMMHFSSLSRETFEPPASPTRFLVTPEKTTFKQKIKKVFVIITH